MKNVTTRPTPTRKSSGTKAGITTPTPALLPAVVTPNVSALPAFVPFRERPRLTFARRLPMEQQALIRAAVTEATCNEFDVLPDQARAEVDTLPLPSILLSLTDNDAGLLLDALETYRAQLEETAERFDLMLHEDADDPEAGGVLDTLQRLDQVIDALEKTDEAGSDDDPPYPGEDDSPLTPWEEAYLRDLHDEEGNKEGE